MIPRSIYFRKILFYNILCIYYINCDLIALYFRILILILIGLNYKDLIKINSIKIIIILTTKKYPND